MACMLVRDLRHVDIHQAFFQSKFDTGMYLRLLPGCRPVSGKAVLLNKALYGLILNGRSSYQLFSYAIVECGFEQCMADP